MKCSRASFDSGLCYAFSRGETPISSSFFFPRVTLDKEIKKLNSKLRFFFLRIFYALPLEKLLCNRL